MPRLMTTPPLMATVMAEGLTEGGLLRLMTWLSPAFPVGGFSYSHGIEYAVECGLLTNRAQTEGWISHILRHGSAWVDAGLFLAAHRAVLGQGDLTDVVDWAAALRGTPEMALEARAQGTAFMSALKSSWPDATLPDIAQPSYAVAVAIAAACAGIPEASALSAFLMAVAANLVSAAVRLVPLGQTDGQRITAALASSIPSIAAAALATPFADLGSAAPMVDWTSMKHETQYTRLFRS